jgi:hypothetical protein
MIDIPTVAVATPLTFARLCEMEPRLLSLLADVRARCAGRSRKRNWCANSAWYGYGPFRAERSLKEQLTRLIGWHRVAGDGPHEGALRSSEAYQIAYESLYNALPGCRACACL